jgi:hypothetical protein
MIAIPKERGIVAVRAVEMKRYFSASPGLFLITPSDTTIGWQLPRICPNTSSA